MAIEVVKSDALIEIHNKQDLFLKLCSLNYLNALVKKDEYKGKIGYEMIKPSVIWTVKTLMKDGLLGLCEELTVNPNDDSVFIRCYGLQFSFHHVNSRMLIKEWPELSNKEAKWDGVRLQPVAKELYELAKDIVQSKLDEDDVKDRVETIISPNQWMYNDKEYNMKYLLVVAHPDDDTLGAGASMWKWSRGGDTIDVCIMCTEAKARAFRPDDKELEADTNASNRFLGVNRIYEGTFPNIEMNTVPHLQMVQFIESAIKESEPDIIITHHPADTNNDHLQTSMACQEAIRLFQRRPEVKRVKEFWYMEVPSCTEWKINNAMQTFNPNCFVEVGKEGVDAKIKALGMYRGVMRPYPHPRSAEYISGLAAVRGSQWGVNYAEAFEVVLRAY